jgi:hypothetical protein
MAMYQTKHEIDEKTNVIVDFARGFHRNFAQIAMMQGRHSPAECPYCNFSTLDPNSRFCDLCDPTLYPFDKLPANVKQQFVAGVAGVFALGVLHFELGDGNFWRDVLCSAAPALSALVSIPDESAEARLAALESDPRIQAILRSGPPSFPDSELASLEAAGHEVSVEPSSQASPQAGVGDMLSKAGPFDSTDPDLVGNREDE